MPEPVIRLESVTKRFPGGIVANESVALDLYEGEIHALVGENGAGKTTLMNLLFGLYEPDEGHILVEGRRVRHTSPADAIANGIGMVHQHFKLVPTFTVAENLLLAGYRAAGTYLNRDQSAQVVASLGAKYGLHVDPVSLAGSLPLAAQQRVEILKALHQDARILILDEPTTVLTPAQVETLYEILNGIAGDGRGVILITHHLDDVFRFSNRVTVLRAGRVVGGGATDALSRDEVARLIVGRELAAWRPRKDTASNQAVPPRLVVTGVTVPASASSTGLSNLNLDAREREVLAIAGVEGNGQRELFDVIAGLRPPASGRVTIGGRQQTPTNRRESARLGVSVVPEDRQLEGVVLELNVAENLLLDRIRERPYARMGVLILDRILASARALIRRFGIGAAAPTVRVTTLSGGNQQKVVLARALRDAKPVILAHQPTRGLDVGATREVLNALTAAAEAGSTVVLISSNLDEVLAVADRVAVMYRGRIVGTASATEATRELLGRWMIGLQTPA